MKYLTKQNILDAAGNKWINLTMGRTVGKQVTTQIFNEMIAYKTLEEDLGIDLFTLFRAFNSKVIFIRNINEIFSFVNKQVWYDIPSKQVHITGVAVLNFKDYGRLWALTREELG